MNLPSLLQSLAAVAVVTASALAASPAFSQAAAAKEGSAAAGKAKAALCIGCHGIVGYQASFPEIYKVPKISGQSAKYIVSALNAYKAGERKHPTMGAIATPMTEQDMLDYAAFYSTHGADAARNSPAAAPAPSAAVDALIKKGACVSCHGDNFNKPNADNVPKLAGQHADYLTVALKAYKTENNAKVGRANAVMSGFAKQYTNAELKQIAAYIASLDSDLKVVPQSKFR